MLCCVGRTVLASAQQQSSLPLVVWPVAWPARGVLPQEQPQWSSEELPTADEAEAILQMKQSIGVSN